MTMTCSPPSFSQSPAGKFVDVFTGQRNHQMFAYCPTISQQKCGVPGGSSEVGQMKLLATTKAVTVSTTELNYLKQGYYKEINELVLSSDAQYDACYYEINMDESVNEMWIPQ